MDLFAFITSKYGKKSMAGIVLNDRIAFVLDSNAFFAQRIFEMTANKNAFKENHLEIIYLFLSRFSIDLHAIRLAFNERNELTLRQYLKQNAEGHVALYFLLKMLDAAK